MYRKEEIVAEAITRKIDALTRKIKYKSPQFGEAFEALFLQELRSYIDCKNPRSLNFWRSTSYLEVDFIYDRRIANEVKGKTMVAKWDLSGTMAPKEENIAE